MEANMVNWMLTALEQPTPVKELGSADIEQLERTAGDKSLVWAKPFEYWGF